MCGGKGSKIAKIVLFVVFFGKELTDMILDWLLYHQLKSFEEGLVFGPFDNRLLNIFLFCTLVGSAVGLFDIVNRFKGLVTNKPFLNIGFTEASVIWIENIPQLVIGILVLICRGEAKSLLTFIKAVVILIFALVSVILAIRDCQRNKNLSHEEQKRLIPLLMIGICFALFLSVATFFITFGDQETRNYWLGNWKQLTEGEKTAWDAFGRNKFNVSLRYDPFSLLNFDSVPANLDFSGILSGGEISNTEKYFAGVGIYGNFDFLTNNMYANKSWVKLLDINEVREYGTLAMQVIFSVTNAGFIQTRIQSPRNETTDCYQCSHQSDYVIYTKPAESCMLPSEAKYLIYKFRYLPPNSRQVLGDIEYNVLRTDMMSCKDNAHEFEPDLRYFKANGTLLTLGHLYGPLTVNDTQYRMYDADEDLLEIRKVWRTGLVIHAEKGFFKLGTGILKQWKCDNTGSVSPHLNTDIVIPCPDAH